MGRLTGQEEGVALITSRYWEGAYALKQLVDRGVMCAGVIIQRTWWRECNSFDYSDAYLQMVARDRTLAHRHYYTIEEIAIPTGIPTHPVENINDESAVRLLRQIAPSHLVVVGSRIIKPPLIEQFPQRVINYHTGLLPEYRGPYSEFWAIYRQRLIDIGTTIHLIDAGIDTGAILARRPTRIPHGATPHEAHITNAQEGALLLADTVARYMAGEITPTPQDEETARYYTYPTDEQIEELVARIGRQFLLYFAD